MLVWGRETSQVFLRYIFAFLAALTYFKLTNYIRIKIQRRDLIFLVVAMVFGYALNNVFFTYGILNTQISVALFLSYSYIIITPVASLLLLQDRLNRFNLIALAVSLGALVLLFQPTPLPTWKIGAFFALLSALSQAVYIILRRVLTNYPANFMMLGNTLAGVLAVGFLSFLLEKPFYSNGTIINLPGNIWLVTVLFGLDNFAAWLAMTKGFEYFKAAPGSLILLSEIAFGIILALTFFQEIPSIMTLVGGVLILFSSGLVILRGEN